MPAYPVEVLWCSNTRAGRSNLWSFPRKVEKLLREETEGKRVLHLFGGRARWGVRMDIDPFIKPDVVGDAWLPPFAKDTFDVVILDPPYVHINAQAKTALLRAAQWVAKNRLIWFSTFWIAGYKHLQPEKAYLVRVGDHCVVRCLQFFSISEPKLPPVKYFTRGPGMKYNRWLMQPDGLPFGPTEASAL